MEKKRSESGAFRQDGMARFPEECRAASKFAISNRPREEKKFLLANTSITEEVIKLFGI